MTFLVYLFYFSFLFYPFLIWGYDTIICDKLINLQNFGPNDIYFIETPDFPKGITDEVKKNCMLNFTTFISNITFVITNGFLDNVEIRDSNGIIKEGTLNPTKLVGAYVFSTSTTNLLFKLKNDVNRSSSWNAFQGYVTVHSHDCLLSLSFPLNPPIILTNESQIAYIELGEERGCDWSFQGPIGYGFKFVIEQSHGWVIDVSNSTGYPIYGASNDQDLQPKAYYNSDNHLGINLNPSDYPDNPNNIPFRGYVTIIKNVLAENDENVCFQINLGKKEIWSFTNYQLNVKCYFNHTVFKDDVVAVNINLIAIEPGADTLILYAQYGLPYSGDFTHRKLFFLDSLKEDFFTYEWVFLSDGSVQNEGFEIKFDTMKCHCADQLIIIPCDDVYILNVMNESAPYVCGNLNCRYNISIDQKCSEKYLLLEILETTGFWQLRIFSIDNILYFDSDKFWKNDPDIFGRAYNNIFLNSSRSYFIIFHSDYGDYFELKFSYIDPPETYKNLILSDKTQYSVFDLYSMPDNSLFYIELDNELKNDILEVYSATYENLKCYFIYENKNMSRVLSPLDYLMFEQYEDDYNPLAPSPFYWKSHTSSMAIYKPYNCLANVSYVLFRAKHAHSKNCVFQNNVVQIDANSSYSMLVKPEGGTCEIIILTNNVTETKDVNYMLSRQIHAPVTFPDDAPFKAFIDTPYFGTPNKIKIYYGLIGCYKIGKFNAEFKVDFLDLSTEGELYLKNSATNQTNLTFVDQKVLYSNTMVGVYYFEPKLGYLGARISILSYGKVVDDTKLNEYFECE